MARLDVATCWHVVAVAFEPAAQAMSPAATIVGSVLRSEKAAACIPAAPETATWCGPHMSPAVSGGLLAAHALLVATITDAAPPGQDAEAPVEEAVNVTFAALAGPVPSETADDSGDEKG